MTSKNYFSHCTTWNLIEIVDKQRYYWRCSFCRTVHVTTEDKNGWLYCPLCGKKISTTKSSGPIDRIFNAFIHDKCEVSSVVVDWRDTGSLVYLCHELPLNANGNIASKLEEYKIEKAMTPMLFRHMKGMPMDIDFQIIHEKDVPKKTDDAERFVFLDPRKYPRYEEELDERIKDSYETSKPNYRRFDNLYAGFKAINTKEERDKC